MLRPFLMLAMAAFMAPPGQAQSCAAQSIRWEKDGATHRTLIEPRTRNGCPMLRQTISRFGATLSEAVGADCNCDLLIDGEEDRFTAPNQLVAQRMIGVCEANKATATPRDVYEMSSAG